MNLEKNKEIKDELITLKKEQSGSMSERIKAAERQEK